MLRGYILRDHYNPQAEWYTVCPSKERLASQYELRHPTKKILSRLTELLTNCIDMSQQVHAINLCIYLITLKVYCIFVPTLLLYFHQYLPTDNIRKYFTVNV